MKLYVTRHGETDYNVMGRYAGSTDVSLNENGFIQARNLAEKLKAGGTSFNIVVSSPLLRARQTAEIICSELNMKYTVIEQFAERNVGVFEGLTQNEISIKYPNLWERKCTRKMDDTPTNGETIRQFDERVMSGIKELSHKYPNDSVLLVSHGFVSRVINRYFKGLSYEEMHCFTLENCGIAEYVLNI